MAMNSEKVCAMWFYLCVAALCLTAGNSSRRSFYREDIKGDTTSCPHNCTCIPRGKVICTAAGFIDIPLPIPSDTTHLDLRFNLIRRIRRHAFIDRNLHNLETILLQNNEIVSVEGRAFFGLNHLHQLSLAGNKLTTLSADAFAGVSGDEEACKHTYCTIDLTDNPITLVEQNAFAWLRWMALLFGHGSTSLIIKAYAFYGVTDIPKVSVVNVSDLEIQPRAFTNANKVGVIDISTTVVSRLQNFTFQGLSGLGSIQFSHCNLSMDQLAFAAVKFLSAKHKAGGSLHFVNSTIGFLPPNLFAHTNVGVIVIENNEDITLSNYTFSAMSHLHTLILKDNDIARIPPYALSNLHDVNSITIIGNKLQNIDTFAFKNTRNVEHLDIGGSPHTDLTIDSHAFSQVSNISQFNLHDVGNLYIKPHAFQALYKVQVMEISRLHLPSIPQHAFHGLSAVDHLHIIDCNVSSISPNAFDHQYIHGEIHNFDISTGNALKCDCKTKALESTFKMAFNRYNLSCSYGTNVWNGDFVSLPFPSCTQVISNAGNTAKIAVSCLGLSLLAATVLQY